MLAPNSHELEARLAKFTEILLRTNDEGRAVHESGAGPNARAIAARRLAATGTLAARPPPGRPPKYNDEVCCRAFQLLGEHDGEQLTLIQLLALLLDEGTVEAPGDVDNMSSALKKYAAQHGYHIHTTFNSTTFFMRESDWEARVRFCRQHLALLQDPRNLARLIILDETTVEECPHPKCECYCWGWLR